MILNPRKRASIDPHNLPNVRLAPSHAWAISMRDWCTNPIQNNRGKQGMSIHTPAKHLLEEGPQPPEKNRQQRPFSSPHAERLARQRKRPLPWDWDASPTSGFSKEIASAYALALLAAIELPILTTLL